MRPEIKSLDASDEGLADDVARVINAAYAKFLIFRKSLAAPQ